MHFLEPVHEHRGNRNYATSSGRVHIFDKKFRASAMYFLRLSCTIPQTADLTI